jgi:integrase/recombinase XerD
MALEHIFKCQRTIGKILNSPFGEFAKGFCEWLLGHGFSHSTMRHHFFRLSHLCHHSKINKCITQKSIKTSFEAYASLCGKNGGRERFVRQVGYSVNRFSQYLEELGICGPLPEQEIYQALLDDYLNWMHHHQNASKGTLELRRHCLTQFLRWLGPEATPKGLSKLTAKRIETFFLSYSQNMGRSARRSMQSALRTFLRFCLHKGYIAHPLDQAVPTLRTYKLATMPRGLTEDEAQKVLQCANQKSRVGQRDYAILQLLYTYGVRGGQVRALQMKDINWTNNSILFKACKCGKDIQLPLTAEVGEAVLDYLKNSRPSCSDSHVFLTCRAPYHPLPYSSSLSAIVERHIKAAGVNPPGKGAHAFRHGFATRMLQQGHSLKEIADVLGHRHLGTTSIYTKVDFNSLEQVPLKWPQEVLP